MSFHAQISQAFDIIARATTAARPSSLPTLNIWCIPGIANRLLLSRLPELTGPPRNWEVNLQPTSPIRICRGQRPTLRSSMPM